MKRLLLIPIAALMLLGIASIPALIDKDLIPDSDDAYDIGSEEARWQDIYASNSLNVGSPYSGGFFKTSASGEVSYIQDGIPRFAFSVIGDETFFRLLSVLGGYYFRSDFNESTNEHRLEFQVLPTSDPGNPGQVWVDANGFLKVSP